MRKEHPNQQDLEMNETRAATMKRILENRPLLMQLREKDREALIRHYTQQLIAQERSNG
jgi:hypothetical protein